MNRSVALGLALVGTLGTVLWAQVTLEPLFSEIDRDLTALAVQLDAVQSFAASADWPAAGDALETLRGETAVRGDDFHDLNGQQAALLEAFLAGLQQAIDRQNSEDAVALSQVAQGTLEQLRQAFQSYLEVGTVVALDPKTTTVGSGVETVLFVQNLPRRGLAAYELRLTVDPSQLRLEDVEPVLGIGHSQVQLDVGAGTAHLSGFNVGGFFANRLPPEALALARVRLTVLQPGTATIDVQIEALLDGQSTPIVALDLDGEVRAP